MKEFFAVLGLVAFGFVFVLLAPILSAIFGAVSGWVVSLMFDSSIKSAFAAFGVDTSNIELWQVGAMLGFVGGFFRSGTRKEKS